MSHRRERAEALNDAGLEHEEAGRAAEATSCYREAAEVDPTFASPCYNLGLLAKYAGDWTSSRLHNLEAVARDPADEAAWWNLGIAATALGDWALARRAWRACGLEAPDGAGPVDLPCGFGPVRLDPGGRGEVVWGVRIDPARVRIASIPYPESGFRFHDVVLNDGAPNGTRMLRGREVPVFDVLERLAPSAHDTYFVEARAPHDLESQTTIQQVALDAGGAAEDWSHSVRILCRACSEGRPHETHEHGRGDAEDVRTLALSATSDAHARAICDVLAKAVPTLHVFGIRKADE